MCNIIYERSLLAKIYFTKFNGYYALKSDNSCLSKDTFHILTNIYIQILILYNIHCKKIENFIYLYIFIYLYKYYRLL